MITETIPAEISYGSQRGYYAHLDQQARRRLVAAHDALAQRLGRPAFDEPARAGGRREMNLTSIGDLEVTALLAEAVVALAAETDRLALAVDTLERGQGRSKR
jgi:hypothetical protein